MKELYPRSYKGFIRYEQCFRVFSNSLINLNISPLNEVAHNGHYYYLERLPQIMGCDGIMLSNNNFGDLLIPNVDYLYIEKVSDIIPKIKALINDHDKRKQMRDNVIQKKAQFNYMNVMSNVIQMIKKIA